MWRFALSLYGRTRGPSVGSCIQPFRSLDGPRAGPKRAAAGHRLVFALRPRKKRCGKQLVRMGVPTVGRAPPRAFELSPYMVGEHKSPMYARGMSFFGWNINLWFFKGKKKQNIKKSFWLRPARLRARACAWAPGARGGAGGDSAEGAADPGEPPRRTAGPGAQRRAWDGTGWDGMGRDEGEVGHVCHGRNMSSTCGGLLGVPPFQGILALSFRRGLDY